MPLENATYIKDLNPANPTGADPKSQGDDHLRLIKQVLLDCFPGFAGVVLVGGTSTGTDGAYILTPEDPLIAYTVGTIVVWKPNVINTGAATINVSGLGVRNILQSDGAQLLAGDMSQYVVMVDTGTEYRILGITKNYIDQLMFSTALPGQPGTATEFELITKNNVASWSLRSQKLRSARTSNTKITTLDQASLIDFTAGGFTQEFDLPQLLTNGFHVTLKNSSSGDVELAAPAAVTTASGTIATPGTVTSFNVPAGLAIVAGDLVIVRRTSIPLAQRIVATVASYTANAAQPISTITNVGNVATLTTTAPHGRATGDSITVSGATPVEYNGTFVVTVTGANTMTYTMTGTPSSTALPVGSYLAGSTLALTVTYRIDETGVAPVTLSTITAGGTIATATTAAPHNLATGNYVTVAGATPAPFNGQFLITVTSATTFTYNMASAPGGNATVVGAYTIQFNNWTITTRGAAAGIDGKASYLMFPGEERVVMCDGTALDSYVVNGFIRDWMTTGPVLKPPGYKSFSGSLTAGAPSGMKSGSVGTKAFGSGGGATLEFSVAASFIPDSANVIIGSGGIGPTATSAGANGTNSTYAGMTAYTGAPGNSFGSGGGGGLLSAATPATSVSVPSNGGRPISDRANASVLWFDSSLGGGQGALDGQGISGSSVNGGAAGAGDPTIAHTSGASIKGGAGSGSVNGASLIPPGISTFAGNGGPASSTGNGGNGVVPGGAGGPTQTGTKAGDGASGRLRMKGEL